MVLSIPDRELIEVTAGGTRLRGTHHKSEDSASRSNNPDHGLLFLNSGFMPRTAAGDTAVYWADSFARCGYSCFRFDLPGLGDSEGKLPAKRLDYAHLVNTGYYRAFISSLAKNLAERFNLAGIVIVGHCAGAVSAIYAASASRYIKGVLALDPYFFEEDTPQTEIRAGMSRWATRSRLAGHLSKMYGGWKKMRQAAGPNKLPKNANVPLIRCWNQIASTGMPVLVLHARQPRQGDFDYFAYLQASSRRARGVSIKFIEGASHSFAEPAARMAVREQTESWLQACFPLNNRAQRSTTLLNQREAAISGMTMRMTS